MKHLYRLYQLLVALPVAAVATLLTSVVVTVGCTIGNGNFWGYWPGRIWAWVMIRVLLLPVKVEGRENLEPGRSYVFAANHQGAFDIFLIYGFLHRNFKWMMKHQLARLPFVGLACRKSHQVFVDKRTPAKVRQTYANARKILSGGMSLVVFPEGARTFTGHMGRFKKGAFALAKEAGLQVVPITINGSFRVMPRIRDMKWVEWQPLSLTIHPPVEIGEGEAALREAMDTCYGRVMGALEKEYQGFVENEDQ